MIILLYCFHCWSQNLICQGGFSHLLSTCIYMCYTPCLLFSAHSSDVYHDDKCCAEKRKTKELFLRFLFYSIIIVRHATWMRSSFLSRPLYVYNIYCFLRPNSPQLQTKVSTQGQKIEANKLSKNLNSPLAFAVSTDNRRLHHCPSWKDLLHSSPSHFTKI